MNIEIYIDGVQKTDIRWRDFRIIDKINNDINTCELSFLLNGSTPPTAGQEVEVYNGETQIFGGSIIDITRQVNNMAEVCEVTAADYTHILGRSLIVERFTDKTVDYIINFLLDKYHLDFTSLSQCDITISRITFDNISTLEAIDKLAEVTNYKWRVDYDKNVKFFATSDENAPFDLTDDNNSYIWKSLVLKDDISQLRNSVKIRGGETIGEERTERIDGDGEKDIFSLSNKFSDMPTVTVDGVEVDVGVDHLDDEEDFDAFWNSNEKYIRFSDPPAAGTNNIQVTGTPLIPIIVKKTDNESIQKYGLHEFFKWDKSLETEADVARYADSQLDAYKDDIIEAEFSTYKDGLKTGQIINIQSDKRDVNEDFLIQSVDLKMRSHKDGQYKVKLATTKTIDIIELLQDLLKTEQKILTREQEVEPLLTFAEIEDTMQVSDTLQDSTDWIVTSPPYTWEDTTGDTEDNPIKWNYWTWEEAI